MPAPNDARDRLGFRKAQGRQGFQRVRIVIAAGKDQAARSAQRRRFLEQAGIVVLDPLEMVEQGGQKGVGRGISHESGEGVEFLSVFRQRLGLTVLDHLQAMLDGAQKIVSDGQVAGGPVLDAAGGHQGVDRAYRRSLAEAGVPSAEDELLRLGKKFDLADAAPSQLYIVARQAARRTNRAAAATGVDLALDRMHVLNGGEIQVSAPDEGPQPLKEGRPRGHIAGHDPRLDHRGALPVLAHALVVDLGGVDRQRDRGRGGIRAQAQICAENIAIGRALLEQIDQALGQPHHLALEPVGTHNRDFLRVEENDQIDIAGIVQFMGAKLPHTDHEQAARAVGCVLLRIEGEYAAARCLPDQGVERGSDGPIGKVAERPGDGGQRPGAGQIGQRDAERHLAARRAQNPGDGVDPVGLGKFLPGRLQNGADCRIVADGETRLREARMLQ